MILRVTYYNHYYAGCYYVRILSNLEGNSDTRTLCVIVVTITVGIVLIFGTYLAMPHGLYPLCPPLALELIVLMNQIRVLFITNHPPRQIPFILLRLSTQIQTASM